MATIDFQRDVLERSRELPVLVDFWAPWCAPCRMLGPVLEELATEAGGRWELVQVNTEEQPDDAADYGVMSIPAVKLFHRGAVVGEFVGALPREQVERFLEAHLPDPAMDELDALAARWAGEGGRVLAPALRAYVEAHPANALGRLRLAQALVADDPVAALRLVDEAENDAGADLADLVDDLRALAELMEREDDVPPKLAPHVQGARQALREHDLDAALDRLVDAATADRHWRDELARRAAVALFRLLGQDDERTRRHQRRLAMALHV